MSSPDAKAPKVCFVIAPIGNEGSDIRLRSDQILNHLITPAARECGYEPLRADQISEPGLITSQVIQHVVEDPLVIADLSGRNPNVFYELALRHAIKKPVVQIINATEPIPFDIAASRTVHVDHRDLDSVAKAKEEIIRQIKSVEGNPEDVDNPISVAVELQSLRRSDNPLEKSYAEIITLLTEIRGGMVDLRDLGRRDEIHPMILDELLTAYERITTFTDRDPTSPMTPEETDFLQTVIRRMARPLEMLCRDAGVSSDVFLRRARRLKP